MLRMIRSLLVALVFAGLAASAGADTLKEQAKKAVAAGLEAQSAGRYDEAIGFYKKAYDAVPHPELLFNLAQAYRLKGDPETALGMYQRYLAVEPKGRVAADARRWAAELEKIVAQRRVEAAKADEARKVDEARKAEEVRKAEEARKADVSKGDAVQTEARNDAHGVRTDTRSKPDLRNPGASSADAGAGTEAGKPARPAYAEGAASRRKADATRPVASVELHDESGGWSRRRYGLLTAGAGGAVLVTGAVFGVLARSKRDSAIAICGEDGHCDSADDTAKANSLMSASRMRGNVSTALLAVGGAGVVIGAILMLTGRETPTRTTLAPMVAPSAIGLAWGGRF